MGEMTRPSIAVPRMDSSTFSEWITGPVAGFSARSRDWLWLLSALLPAILAVASCPQWTTQDGPAHVYNAHLLNQLAAGDTWLSSFFEARWTPLPNWAGHLLLMGWLSVLPAVWAERFVSLLTLGLVSGSVLVLRHRLHPDRSAAWTAPAAAVVGLNMAWLMGFTSFLLGVGVWAWSLAVWWNGRDRPRRLWAIQLAALVILGYACHLVTFGLIVGSLGLLMVATPPTERCSWRARWGWTLVGVAPFIPLFLLYRALATGQGPFQPIWEHPWLSLSPSVWATRLGWVDPISLASKVVLPFRHESRPWHALLTPAPWWSAGLLVGLMGAWSHRQREHRGWWLLASGLLAGGLLGPDSLGLDHGHYLPQRLALLGLLLLLVLAQPPRVVWLARVGLCVGLAAWLMQTAFVWDYAQLCRVRVTAWERLALEIGAKQRIGTLLLESQVPFRSNPLLHVDCRLGVGTGNIIWSNYETTYYYFPIRYRYGVVTPPAREFERIARLDGPANAEERRKRWLALLEEHHERIDRVVIWGRSEVDDDHLTRITARWFPSFDSTNDQKLRISSH